MDIYKKYCRNFQLLKAVFVFFYFFCFVIYKIVDSEYNMDIYRSVKICIGAVMRNAEMLKFVADHFKTKKMLKITFRNTIYSRSI